MSEIRWFDVDGEQVLARTLREAREGHYAKLEWQRIAMEYHARDKFAKETPPMFWLGADALGV